MNDDSASGWDKFFIDKISFYANLQDSRKLKTSTAGRKWVTVLGYRCTPGGLGNLLPRSQGQEA